MELPWIYRQTIISISNVGKDPVPVAHLNSALLAPWPSTCHFYTMKSTIDTAGRVVIPKALRMRLGLRGGEAIEIRERDGTIEIEPVPTPMTLVGEGDRALAAVPKQELPPLTDDLVRATLEGTRR